MKQPRVEGILKCHQAQPCVRKGDWMRFSSTWSGPVSKTSSEVDSTISLGWLFQWMIFLTIRNFFFILRWMLCQHNLYTLPLFRNKVESLSLPFFLTISYSDTHLVLSIWIMSGRRLELLMLCVRGEWRYLIYWLFKPFPAQWYCVWSLLLFFFIFYFICLWWWAYVLSLLTLARNTDLGR